MKKPLEFGFNNAAIAENYDSFLVPILFDSWADALIKEFDPWTSKHVLDLATGTGIIAQHLTKQVGPRGKVFASDINPQMMARAAKRCAGSRPEVVFVESPASPLNFSDNRFDFVVCQQGFQFFPEKDEVAREIFRVLKPNGQVAITTWCSIRECAAMDLLNQALDLIGETEIAELIKVPFNSFDGKELLPLFKNAGFKNSKYKLVEKEFLLPDGLADAIRLAYATPIGPKLLELSDDQQENFRSTFRKLITDYSPDGIRLGKMVSHHFSAKKPV